MVGRSWLEQDLCNLCSRKVLNTPGNFDHWSSVGFPCPRTGRGERWYDTFWECPETREGFTVICHCCALADSLAAADAELREAQERFDTRHAIATRTFCERARRQEALQEEVQEAVANERACVRREQVALQIRRERLREHLQAHGPCVAPASEWRVPPASKAPPARFAQLFPAEAGPRQLSPSGCF